MTGIDGFVIDLDGTVYRGKHAIDGAVDAIVRSRMCRNFQTVSSDRQ